MIAELFQVGALRLDLIALLRAHKPSLPLLLQDRGLELMPNPVVERFIAANPIDALDEPARNP